MLWNMEGYRRWEDNIKMNVNEIGVYMMNLTELALDSHF
jgi:hypothetical protein